MSYDTLGVSDAMLDSLSLQLREAEARRAEAERAHQDALAQLRGLPSTGLSKTSEAIETLQSRARELEKKAALETVRCEELQLELSAALKSRSGRQTSTSQATTNATVTWAPTPGSEIDRIMAKIEQDNRILAELEHPRTTGPIMSTSLVTGNTLSGSGITGTGLTGSGLTNTGLNVNSSIVPQTNNNLTSLTGVGLTSALPSSGLTNQISNSIGNPLGVQITSSTSSHGITDALTGTATGTVNTTFTGPNVSPLPVRAHQINAMPPLCQSTTMPVLSLHNTYSLPSGSASYTLGLSGAPVASSYTYPTVGSVTAGGVGNVLGTGLTGTSTVGPTGVSSILGTGLGLSTTNPLTTTTLPLSLGAYNTSSSYSTYTNPLLTTTVKLNALDDLDLGVNRYSNRAGTPCSPIPPTSWGLDSFSAIDGVNPAFIHTQRPLSRLGGLDLESRTHGLTLNGNGEPQVDMLDIPGKGRCCVFIARFSYDPPDESEGELSLCAGDYLLVWGSGEPQGGYYDAEMLDGRRGLVPASFVQRLIGDDLLEFHQAVVSTLRDADDVSMPLDPAPLPPNNPLVIHSSEDMARLSETHGDLGSDQTDEDADTVPAPRHLTLERQLNKSVLIGWSSPEPPGCNQIESYHVYVDGVLKVTVKASERTRALVEGVDSNRPHRISVRSVTQNRRTSRDAACTMIIGRDTAHLGPSAVRASNITCSSAVISWLPANSNHQHVVCVNNVEVRTVKPGVYRHTITGLAPSTQYRVTVRAKHLRAPGQAPPPGPPPEEAPGAYTDFRTLAKGLPDPPQDIQVETGPQDNTLLVTWQPVTRPPSSGPVTGYAVYADGKKVTDVDSPTGDHALIDISKLIGLNPRAVTVRTKSRDAQSADSQPTIIPIRNATRNRHNIPHAGLPPHMRNQRPGVPMVGPMGNPLHNQQNLPQQNQMQTNNQQLNQQLNQLINQQPQQVIEHDENLSDKEVYPGSMHQQQMGYQSNSNNRMDPRNRNVQQGQMNSNQQYYGPQNTQRNQIGQLTQQGQQQQQQQQQQQAQQRGPQMRNNQMTTQQQQQQQLQQKKPRFFLAMFDYDPSTMSPNPDGCEEELPFQEGDTIRVYGDKDPDGFYWGELRGRRGYVPHNMVTEIDENQAGAQGGVGAPGTSGAQSVRGISRDRWGDIYANTPVKRMIALYDYDPQELSPNVDAEQVELTFKTGDVILVYGDMDEDGFFMGELDGVRGLVPSNFLTEAPDQYNNQMGQGPSVSQRNLNNRGRGQGLGARGPPPPPRDNMGQISGQINSQMSSQMGTQIGSQMGAQMGSQMGTQLGQQMNQQVGNMGGIGQMGNMNQIGMNRQQMNQMNQQRKDARPTSPTLLDNTGHPAPDHQTQGMQGKGGMIGRGIGIGGNNNNQPLISNQQTTIQSTDIQQQQQMQNQQTNQQQNNIFSNQNVQPNQQTAQQQQQQQQQQQIPSTTASSTGGMFSTASNLFSGATNAATGGLFNTNRQPPKGPQVIPQTGMTPQQQQQPMHSMGGPFGGFNQQNQQQQQQQQQQQGPNLMQKLNEITAPGGDILSKGKELIFMKFGLGGK